MADFEPAEAIEKSGNIERDKSAATLKEHYNGTERNKRSHTKSEMRRNTQRTVQHGQRKTVTQREKNSTYKDRREQQ